MPFRLATVVSSNPFNFVNALFWCKQMRIDRVIWITAHNYGKPKWHSFMPSLSWKGEVLDLDIVSTYCEKYAVQFCFSGPPCIIKQWNCRFDLSFWWVHKIWTVSIFASMSPLILLHFIMSIVGKVIILPPPPVFPFDFCNIPTMHFFFGWRGGGVLLPSLRHIM